MIGIFGNIFFQLSAFSRVKTRPRPFSGRTPYES